LLTSNEARKAAVIAKSWTTQDQLDWELLREADEDIASQVTARRPDLVRLWERAVANSELGGRVMWRLRRALAAVYTRHAWMCWEWSHARWWKKPLLYWRLRQHSCDWCKPWEWHSGRRLRWPWQCAEFWLGVLVGIAVMTAVSVADVWLKL
jgi:hypothetical protein